MDADLKKKWVDALRSGEYKQGINKLKDANTGGHCCLGVLCAIDPDIKEIGATDVGSRYIAFAFGHIWETTRLAEHYQNRQGFTHSQMNHVMSMNDEGKSFSEIADYIDEHF